MSKVKSLADLKKKKEDLQNKMNLREKSDHPEKIVGVKVAMATCGIAAGAKETYDAFIDELDKQAIEAVVSQTGCMGYCYAEPTVQVTLPGEAPVVYGNVDTTRVKEIIEKHVKQGELADGIIPENYKTIDHDPDNE